MVEKTEGSNAQYLHQLDSQDGGAHQSPLGLLWLGGGGGRNSGHIIGLSLIISCHTDENSVKNTFTDLQYVCHSACMCVSMGALSYKVLLRIPQNTTV